jgi:hypothetical protein
MIREWHGTAHRITVRYGNRVPLLIDSDRPSFRKSHIELRDIEGAGWMFEAVFDYGDGHYRDEPPDEHGRVLSHAGAEARTDWAEENTRSPPIAPASRSALIGHSF